MTLQQIKAAVEAGQTVHWGNERYKVIKDGIGQFLIVCDNGYVIGLTHQDGVTLNGREDEFYVAPAAAQ